jgi:subtilisin family serine protease
MIYSRRIFMRARGFICIFLGLWIGLMPVGSWASRPDKRSLPSYPPEIQTVPDEVLIKFRSNLSSTDQRALAHQFQVPVTTREQAVNAFHAYYKTRPLGSPLLGWQRVKIPAGEPLAQALADISTSPLVEKAEPNYLSHAVALSNTYTAVANPNDFYYQNGTTWWLNRTKSDLAFNRSYPFGSGPVIVAVVDTGVDFNHPDLFNRTVGGYNAITPSGQPLDDDTEGHGTHVAGLLGAESNNGIGICGTAYQSAVKIMPVKVLDYTGSGNSADIVTGVLWAVGQGARVLNLSFGGGGISSAEMDAYNQATAHGCVLVAAAGNNNMDLTRHPLYPAALTNVIAVAATDSMDFVAAYSNYGEGVIALAAPGGETTDLSSPLYDGGIWSLRPNNAYQALVGTSMAAPQISAVAAMLILQNPGYGPSDVRAMLAASCENPYGDTAANIGAGRINAAAAYAIYKTPTVTPTVTVTPTITPTSTITVTSTPLSLHPDEVFAYPQPARDQVRIAYNVSGPARIRADLFNAAGNRVLHLEEIPYSDGGVAYTQILTRQLGAGIYYLVSHIDDASGQRMIKRRIAVVH